MLPLVCAAAAAAAAAPPDAAPVEPPQGSDDALDVFYLVLTIVGPVFTVVALVFVWRALREEVVEAPPPRPRDAAPGRGPERASPPPRQVPPPGRQAAVTWSAAGGAAQQPAAPGPPACAAPPPVLVAYAKSAARAPPPGSPERLRLPQHPRGGQQPEPAGRGLRRGNPLANLALLGGSRGRGRGAGRAAAPTTPPAAAGVGAGRSSSAQPASHEPFGAGDMSEATPPSSPWQPAVVTAL
eukprot:TRINITY_DN20673_c0_g1_i1.p1 TRINITY_DN20673_c0_g1~~TRINITY_DN20673_c0_g1_i1.p1  ORF type:complete len:240 (+),score=41.15 TRINITY_DN20673_c0_g1_i1:106-825(+)